MKTLKLQIIDNGRTVKKDFPASFGTMFLAKASEELGMGISNLDDALKANEFLSSLKLIKVSLEQGARISKKEFNLEIEDIADACDRDADLIPKFFEMMEESLTPKKQEAAEK